MQHSAETASAPALDNPSVAFVLEGDTAQPSKIGHRRQMLWMSQLQMAEFDTKFYCKPNNRDRNYTDREFIARLDGAIISKKGRPYAIMTSTCKGEIEITGGNTDPGAATTTMGATDCVFTPFGETLTDYRPKMARGLWPI